MAHEAQIFVLVPRSRVLDNISVFVFSSKMKDNCCSIVLYAMNIIVNVCLILHQYFDNISFVVSFFYILRRLGLDKARTL